MSQSKENSEFRCVHIANATLEKYITSGRNIEIIRSIPKIERIDVWMAVFGKENPEAIRELQIREIYEDLQDKAAQAPECRRIMATFMVHRLEQMVEWKTPLTIEDAIKVILDAMGDDFIKELRKEAKVSVARRTKIVEPYHKKDDEWVGYAKTVLEALK